MLKVIRRLFSFSDWEASHPSSPPPGQWLDGQFNEIIDQVEALDGRFRAAISADGRVSPGSVTKDSLDPAFFADLSAKIAEIGEILLESARRERQTAENAARVALFAQNSAEDAKNRVIAAETAAEPFHSTLQTGLQTLSEQVDEARTAAATAQAAVTALDEMEDYAGYSEAWARTSALWAEHMPDTLPASALVSLDISGDHWSSRWWANRAAHSFGKLTELYLGAHPSPPLTNSTGGPIVVGSIYYDTTTGRAYVWNGTGWVPLWTPAASNTLSLWYSAIAAQVAFPTSTPDVNGNSFVIDPANPEGVEVHVNGLLKEPDLSGPGGDYTIDPATSTITFAVAPGAGARVAIDIMSSPADIRPGAMNAWALDVIEDPNGTLTVFTVDVLDPTGPPTATIGRAEELIVSVDGVLQAPGTDYQAGAATLTFSTAPSADSIIFATWFQALGGSPTGDMTPAEILAAIKTVDGAGSGLDADLLDGQHAAFFAPIASPTFTGDPKAPTPATADNDTSIATTAYVVAKLAASGVGVPPDWSIITGKPATFPPTLPIAQSGVTNLVTDLAAKASLVSPVFTGDPQAPTPAVGDEDTSIATTAFVQTAVDSATGAGLFGYFDYTFNPSAFTPPPIAGNFRMNNATQSAATHIYVHEQTATSNDAALMLAQIAAGDKLLIQRKSTAAQWQRYAVTATADMGAYWDFTVTWVDGGSALTNARSGIIVQKPTAGGGGSTAWADITGKPATFPPTVPIAQADITNLTTDLTARVLKAGDTMTGVLAMPGGAAATPSIHFGTASTGLYGSASSVAMSTAGVLRLAISSAAAAFSPPVRTANGAVGAPAYAWTNDTDAGFYLSAAGDMRLAMAGADVVKWLDDKSITYFGPVSVPVGSVSATSLNFGTAGTGLYGSPTAVQVATAGAVKLTIGGTTSSFTAGHKLILTGNTTRSGLGFGAGAPTTPSDGDIWYTTTGFYGQAQGATRPLSIHVGTTAPATPTTNDLWLDTN